MESIDELHEFFDKRGVDEKKLKKIALYVENYAEALFSTNGIELSDEEAEIVSINLYKTLLHQSRSMSMNLDQDAEEILDDVLDDFESDKEKAAGNVIALIGKAGTIEETRHPKITKLGRKIAAQQQSSSGDDLNM